MSQKARILVQEHFCVETKAGPCGMIIFGASGDLAHRKLIPSLFNLFVRNLLPDAFFILGCGRTNMSSEEFRKTIQIQDTFNGEKSSTLLESFLATIHYVVGEYDDEQFYKKLKGIVSEFDLKFNTRCNRILYLALPVHLFKTVLLNIGKSELASAKPGCESNIRVVLEKPFGTDLQSAKELDTFLQGILKEEQIYRIDHYLGKETVQNILLLRFANSIFEPVWNNRYIDHVQITVAESLGVGARSGYYDTAGQLRDMVQNHLFQLLSLTAMEPPLYFESGEIRDEKAKLLKAVRPFTKETLSSSIIRARYDAGMVDEKVVPGYLQEHGVAPDSVTETFFACKLYIDNWRWQNVPFYLRTGKRLNCRASEIAIYFKPVPHSIFGRIFSTPLPPNLLLLRIQPQEGISLTMQAKHPGAKLCIASLTMEFNYREVFGENPPEAYERLLLDCMLGDQTLFIRNDALMESWKLFTPVLDIWRKDPESSPLHVYTAGSRGPEAADRLIEQDSRSWHLLS